MEPDEIRLNEANSKVLAALQNALNEGDIGDGHSGGMILSYCTVVEWVDGEGNSCVGMIWNDNRTTVLMGLLSWGNMRVVAMDHPHHE